MPFFYDPTPDFIAFVKAAITVAATLLIVGVLALAFDPSSPRNQGD